MSEKQQNLAVAGLVAQVNVINGCPPPTDDRHYKILNFEILKFLSDYKIHHHITIEEILCAFRMNSAGKFDPRIEHYQNIFNIDYLGKILNQWIPIRRNIELKAYRDITKKNVLELDVNPNLTNDQIIQFSKDEWDRTHDPLFLESRAYDLITDRGLLTLTTEQKAEVLARVRLRIGTVCRGHNDLYEYDGNRKVESILAKKVSLAEYFNGGLIPDAVPYRSLFQVPRDNSYSFI